MAQGDIYYFGKIGKEEYNTSNKEYTLEPSSTCLEERIILMGQQIGMSQSIKKGENLNEYIETIGEVIVKYKYINGGEDLEIDWEYKAVEDKEENSGVGEGQSTSTNTSDDEWPESYREGINKLKEKYPNWIFNKDEININLNDYVDEEYKSSTVPKIQNDNTRKIYIEKNTYELEWRQKEFQKSKGKKYKLKDASFEFCTKDCIKLYSNPVNFLDDPENKGNALTSGGFFQFLRLDFLEEITKESIKSVLEGSYFDKDLEKYATIFMTIGKRNNINPYMLIAKTFVEGGTSKKETTSKLAKGIEHNNKIVYNFYGIGATDGAATETGKKYAYDKGWFTEEKALEAGSSILKVYMDRGQNTYYYTRFSVKHFEKNKKIGPQYATNIEDARTKANILQRNWKNKEKINLIFNIPVYKDSK